MTARIPTYAYDTEPIWYIKHRVRLNDYDPQVVLLREYTRDGGPRYTLTEWLKRHRLHNPTTRVIPNQ